MAADDKERHRREMEAYKANGGETTKPAPKKQKAAAKPAAKKGKKVPEPQPEEDDEDEDEDEAVDQDDENDDEASAINFRNLRCSVFCYWNRLFVVVFVDFFLTHNLYILQDEDDE
jgi:hypothetical protein